MRSSIRRMFVVQSILVALALPAVTGSAPVIAQEPVTVESISCSWSEYRADGFFYLTGTATEFMTIVLSSDHPELLWPGTGGLFQFNVMAGQEVLYWYTQDIITPPVDTNVTVYADFGDDRVTCGVVIPLVPPTATPTATQTQIPFALESVVCGPWDPLYDREAFIVTVTLTQLVVSDYQVRLTTDRPDMVHWPEDGSKWVTVPAGTLQGEVVIYGKNFSPNEDEVITISAHDQGVTISCQQVMLGTYGTATPDVTGTPPTRTPTKVVTPKPTRTPTVALPPALRTIYTQVGSRSGNLTKVTVCLDRAAPFGGVTVNLASSDLSVIPVPGEISIPTGRECLSTNSAVGPVSRALPVTVTAMLGSRSYEGTTTVRPQRPVVYTQTVSRAGGTSKVTLCSRAPGETVALVSDNAAAFPVPASVTLPTAKQCVSLVIPVGTVSGDETVTITATFSSGVASGSTVVRDLDAST